MKIGDFAKKWNVSIDTVRHYIKCGLLVPLSTSSQFSFNEREDRDMKIIMRMKAEQFSLKEIYNYLEICRVSTMMEPESVQDAISLLNRKKEELAQQIQTLEEVCRDISSDIDALSSGNQRFVDKTGVPLRALPLLACPRCGASLELNGASLNSQYVIKGTLSCSCGYRAGIENGIVKTGNEYSGNYDCPDLKRELYRQVSTEFGINIQKTIDLFHEAFKDLKPKNKVILEGHINGYFFLYNNLIRLDPDNIYIDIDKFPEILEMYKSYIDNLGLNYSILYIADSSYCWPLRGGCADILIDFHGDMVNSFYYHNLYIHNIARYLGNNIQVIGASLGYHNNAKSLLALSKRYPEGDLAGLYWDKQPQFYENEGYYYRRFLIGTMKTMEHKYAYSCHQDGEELLMGFFRAWRRR